MSSDFKEFKSIYVIISDYNEFKRISSDFM